MRTPTLIAIAAVTLSAQAFVPVRASSFLNQPRVRQEARSPRITEFSFPGGALECLASGPDGNLWVTDDYDQDSGEQSAVLRITIRGKQTGKFYYHPIYEFPSGIDIATGADGNLWISDDNDNQLIRMTPKGTFKLVSAPSPFAVTAGPDRRTTGRRTSA